MRILVITNMYPPHHFGGYELSCEDTVRIFRRQGHWVSVLTSTIRVPGVQSPVDEAASGICRELEPYWHDHVLLSPPLRQRLAMERRNQQSLDRALTRSRPDVVSVWNMGALSLGLLTAISRRRLPVVFVIGDNWPAHAEQLDAWSRLFHRPLGRIAGRLVERVTGVPSLLPDFGRIGACCFNSEAMRQAARDHSRWSLPRTGIVYSGIDPGDFPIQPDTADIPVRSWGGHLLYVGRIDERKGIDTVVRALPHLPDARLRILGKGDAKYLDQLRTEAARLGVDSRLTFSTATRAQLRQEYQRADVLVFPSVYQEPFGLVPLEAMACDTPVVGTGQGGSGEFLAEGFNCLLFPPADDQALAAAVRQVAGSPDLRTRLIRGGRETARSLTTEALATSLLAWHEAAQDSYAFGQPPDRTLPGVVTGAASRSGEGT